MLSLGHNEHIFLSDNTQVPNAIQKRNFHTLNLELTRSGGYSGYIFNQGQSLLARILMCVQICERRQIV